MKIEKINDNQIRCILTKEDLQSRQIRLSELAYGSEKAKSLFRDMMERASYEYGFETDDLPLMIEAIPMSAESVILVISKVEYPEELDTRFSRFSEAPEDFDSFNSYHRRDNTVTSEGADDILDLFKKIREEHEKVRPSANMTDADFVPLSETVPVIEEVEASEIRSIPSGDTFRFDITKLFVFRSIDEAMRLARVLNNQYREPNNTLFKSPEDHRLYLVISKGLHTPDEFNKVCNILAEYAIQEKYSPAEEAHFREHYETILPQRAVQTLAGI